MVPIRMVLILASARDFEFNARKSTQKGAPAMTHVTGDPPSDIDASTWEAPTGDDAPREEDKLVVALGGYEGPLDLLLALARTQKVDLRYLSIVALADQYLTYIREAKTLRLELAADYLVMAAWLAFLKSRLLIPKLQIEDNTPSGEDLAARLQFRLMRLEAMRKAAAQLMTRKRLGLDIFQRGMPQGTKTIRERQYTAEIYDLLKAYADQRSRRIVKRAHVVKKREVWSIKDARDRLHRLVGASAVGEWVQLDLFIDQFVPMPGPEVTRTARAASFGATLEMARDGLVELQQAEPYAPIYMRKTADADWDG
jgi:segregation and condensation protein A